METGGSCLPTSLQECHCKKKKKTFDDDDEHKKYTREVSGLKKVNNLTIKHLVSMNSCLAVNACTFFSNHGAFYQ